MVTGYRGETNTDEVGSRTVEVCGAGRAGSAGRAGRKAE